MTDTQRETVCSEEYLDTVAELVHFMLKRPESRERNAVRDAGVRLIAAALKGDTAAALESYEAFREACAALYAEVGFEPSAGGDKIEILWESLKDLSEMAQDEIDEMTEDEADIRDRVMAAEQVIAHRAAGFPEMVGGEAECGWNIRFLNTRRAGFSA